MRKRSPWPRAAMYLATKIKRIRRGERERSNTGEEGIIIRPRKALFSEETGISVERKNFPSVAVRVRGGSRVSPLVR